MDKLISIKDLSLLGKDFFILRDITFDTFKHEVLGVLGENGSGKTSLVHLILKATLEKHENITFSSNLKLGRDIGVVLQQAKNAFNPSIKIGLQVIDSCSIHSFCDKYTAKKLALSYFKRLGLDEKVYDMYPHELSGGMKQRVAIVSAIINKPKLLIFDEITSGLDDISKIKVLDLIDELKTFSTIIFISHDLYSIEKVATRTLVFKDGNLIEAALTKDLFSLPKHPYTKDLLNSRTFKLSEEITPIIELRCSSLNSYCPYYSFCSNALDICKKVSPDKIKEREGVSCWLYAKDK